MRATWRMLAGRRDLGLVLSAGIISMTGDWILIIGLIYKVYATTGSTVAGTLGSGYLSRLAGIIPVLAVQGAGYVVAGLAMLVWLKGNQAIRPARAPGAGRASARHGGRLAWPLEKPGHARPARPGQREKG